jgi:RNA methyltransferase, TrmH family
MPRASALPGTAMAETIIRSRTNPLIKRLRALKERGTGGDLALLEGLTLVAEGLAAGLQFVEAAVTPAAEETARGQDLVRQLSLRRVAVRRVAPSVLESLSETETSQGLLALARRPSFDEEALYAGVPLVIVAAGLQNPGNVGAVLRAAEAAGATGAYFTRGTADPFSWKALRGAMGSAFRLPHVRALAAEDVRARLRRRGVTTLAAVATGGERYDAADLRRPVALLLGQEAAGLEADLAAGADGRITIPMTGGAESLNVAVAAGVLLFEAARQRAAGGRLSR